MATVFKRKRKVKLTNGKIVVRQSQKYYTRLTDADGIKRTIPLFRDKTASQQKAAQLVREVELANAGVTNPYKKQQQKALAEHLADFKDSLTNKGSTEKQAQQVYNRAKDIIVGCKFVFTSDISASKIQSYLAEKRKPTKKKDGNLKEGISIRTSNFYLQAIKQFCRWMVADNRMAKNPIAYLSGQNPNTDIRHARRALTLDEIEKLLEVTINGKKQHSMTGKERYMLYILALSTGFRAGELSTLTWQSFDFDEKHPSVTVQAAYTKNRKLATQQLRSDVATLFRQWQQDYDFESDEKVFRRFNKNKAGGMLKIDLEVAGIPYQDEAGRYADFHASRHTFITNVVKSGATVKEAQSLARHSKPELTLGIYTHLNTFDERRALDKMPSLIDTKKEINENTMLKTGTDNKLIDTVQNGSKELTPKWTPFLTPAAFSGCNRSAAVGNEQGNVSENNENDNCLNSVQLGKESDRLATVGMGEKQKAATGFEPVNNGFANRRLRPLGYAAMYKESEV